MSKKIISIPSLGESSEVEVIEVCVQPGDRVSADDPIVVLESDKAAMELPANADGVVEKILVKVGDGVSEGMNFLELEVADKDGPLEKKNQSNSINEPEDREPDTSQKEPLSYKSIITVSIPNLGESSEVEVIEVCIKEGDTINAEDPLVVLESDKAAMEVPSPKKGTVIKIHQNLGAQVSEGMQLIDLEIEEEEIITPVSDAEDEVSAPQKELPKIEHSNFQMPQTGIATDGKVYAGPAVRKLAREFGITLQQVSPSGPKGRILKEDLHRFVKEKLNSSNQPQSEFNFTSYDVDYSKWGSIKEEALTKFQKSAFKNLHTSWINIPHVTQHDEADITDLLSLRLKIQKNRYTKITPLAFFIKAICKILKDYPWINSYKRKKNLSSDDSLDKLIEHVPFICRGKYILWTHVTSPFFNQNDYYNFIKKFLLWNKTRKFKSAFSADKVQKFIYREDKKWISHNYNKKKWPRTQDLLNSYILNSAALIAERKIYTKNNDRLCSNPLPIISEPKSGFDVDDLNDFKYVRNTLKKNGIKFR